MLFISIVLFAQKRIAPTKNLDAYAGTWVYQANDTIFFMNSIDKGIVKERFSKLFGR